MPLEITPFAPKHYRDARALWERTPGVGLSEADEEPQILAYLERNPRSSFVARAGNILVGTILCGHDGRRGLIHHLSGSRPWPGTSVSANMRASPMSRARRKPGRRSKAGAPYLRRITSLPERMGGDSYPFTVPAFHHDIDIALNTNVTFFVGENGSGKSTLLEAVAEICGFNPEGGSRDHYREALAERSDLAQALRLAWLPKMSDGFFMRAEQEHAI